MGGVWSVVYLCGEWLSILTVNDSDLSGSHLSLLMPLEDLKCSVSCFRCWCLVWEGSQAASLNSFLV